MKAKLLIATLIVIFNVLLFTPITYAEDKGEIEVFFIGKRTEYAETREFLYGGGFRALINRKSYYIDFDADFSARNFQGIEKIRGAYFKIEAEKSFGFFVLGGTYRITEEKARLSLFNEPEEIIIKEMWHREDFTGRLGIKLGQYDKSFFRLAGFYGCSDYNRELDLCGFTAKDGWKTPIAGGSIRSRLKVPIKSKNRSGIEMWIDCRVDYKYFLKRKEHITEGILDLGFRITNHFGIKGSLIAVNKTQEKESIRFVGYRMGLVFKI